MNTLFKDFFYCLKNLTKNTSFFITAVISLALCIACNTIIFNIVHNLILKPLPYPESEKIVEVYNHYEIGRMSSNIPLLVDFRDNTEAFANLALINNYAPTIETGGVPQSVKAMMASVDFFNVFRLQPELGAFFNEEHGIPGQAKVVVLSYTFWSSQYGKDKNVVGDTINVNGVAHEILGVAPRSLEIFFPDIKFIRAFAWKPERENDPSRRHANFQRLFTRLATGVTVEQAQVQVDLRDKIYYDNNPQARDFIDRTQHFSRAIAIEDERVRTIKPILLMLQLGTLFVLIIGAVNIANLLLVRANAKLGELAIRCAVGAGLKDIARLLFLESLILFLGGAILGIVTAAWGIRLINDHAMALLPPMQALSLDAVTIVSMLLASIIFALLVALFPIVNFMRKNLLENLSASGKGVSENRISKALSTVFVSGQIALALMLTVGAGLLLYSLAKVLDGDFGYEPDDVSVVRVRAFGADYRDDDKRRALQAQLLSQLRSKPGIESAGLSGNYPTNSFPIRTFSIRGYEMQDGEAQVSARFKAVSDGYFETMGLELLDGNYFTVSDQVTNRRSLVIDKATAERYFPGESAVGKKMGFVGDDTADEDWPVVVGVVEDSKQLGLDSTEEDVSFFYLNMAERPTGQFFVVVKSKRSPSDVTKIVEAIVHEIDPRVPVLSMGSLEEILGESLARRKVLMTLLAIIAVIAVSLATVGIYGVIAYSLFQKTRELGTRVALGASKLAILNYVMKDGLIKALLGMLLGVAGAVFISRLLAAQLYDVQPTDPSVYALVCLAVLLITMLAVYIPARRASNIAPMEALRTE